MKIQLCCLVLFLVNFILLARQSIPFSGWDYVENNSPYISIVECEKSIPPTPGIIVMDAPASDSNVRILSVLRGTNSVSSARLQTDYELKEGQKYLVFGYYDSGFYRAYEPYRVIPLDTSFRLDLLTGKTLDEKLQVLFQSSIDYINRKIQEDEEERDRLQQALQK